jgi:hypothetical protein
VADLEDVLQYKALAHAALRQAAADILDLPPEHPDRISAERFLRSEQKQYKEIRKLWRTLAGLDDVSQDDDD